MEYCGDDVYETERTVVVKMCMILSQGGETVECLVKMCMILSWGGVTMECCSEDVYDTKET